MPGKQALWFRALGSGVEIDLPRESDDLTAAAWVNIAKLDPGDAGAADERRLGPAGAFHWQIYLDGRIKAAIRADADDKGFVGFGPPLSDDSTPW